MKMDFDLRTNDSAYYSLLHFLGMTREEFVMDYVVECESDAERFWSKHFATIDDVDISDLRFIVFHVTGSLDECQEIKSNGLMNLQEVLSRDTILSCVFKQYDLIFDIPGKTLSYKGKAIDISHEKYVGRGGASESEKLIEKLSHRIYYDYCINGFFYCDDIIGYGTRIHERPEFIDKIVRLFPDLKPLESQWINQSKSYKVNFFVTSNQLHGFTFSLDEVVYAPHDFYQELTDEQKLKKWMVLTAINRGFEGSLGECYLYVKDEIIIPPEQIIDCELVLFERN